MRAAYQLDDTDRRLLTILQRGLPFVSRPYLEIARELSAELSAESLEELSAESSTEPSTEPSQGILPAAGREGFAGSVEITEGEVLERIAALKEAGVIRRLSGFFDSGRLGYVSALCAARVRPEDLKQAAAFVNGYAGVTHNYVREHTYNMWFTLIARDIRERERILDEIEGCPWVEQVLRFYTRSRYKIQVAFDLEHRADGQGRR
ncbi:Lrp/AsnC family transcriptional regulator [Bacilliculturomica massiliensis]|uniref:Lrp/AsnC family transcriptional regulator n=1 Tax=Bacilliculturomica massiliensis TaxID=1917867 RepID=UPI00102F43DC|nr:Lrp/AsnC family transcriptional regulator [Bacilliculturomica massiliensis]